MSGFPVFKEGELLREITIRGLTQEGFASAALVDPQTIARAIRGDRLKPKTFRKILAALDRLPLLAGPVELVVTT